MNISKIVEFLFYAIVYSTPLIFGSVGEIITEKSGNLNLGIPGIMYVGGVSSVIGGYLWETKGNVNNGFLTVLVPFLFAILGAFIMSLLYAFLTVTLRSNQNVTGLIITTFGIGLGSFFGSSLSKIIGSGTSISLNATSAFFKKSLPFSDKLGNFGRLFCSYGFLVYLAFAIALIAAFVIRRTRVGLNLRAVGENPATADAAGINVSRYKYCATCLGGSIAGLGGLFYVMDYMGGTWSNEGFEDRGWLAVALVIFAVWKPDLGILGAILFSNLFLIYNYIPDLPRSAQELFKMLPYMVTIIVLIFTSVRKKRENLPPASLGVSYFREDR